MPGSAPGCAGCRHTGRCSTCLGYGKRIRVTGVLRRRQETVRCRVCVGTGACRMCHGAPPLETRPRDAAGADPPPR